MGYYILFEHCWNKPGIQDFHYQWLLHCNYVHMTIKNLKLEFEWLVFCHIYIPKTLWNHFQWHFWGSKLLFAMSSLCWKQKYETLWNHCLQSVYTVNGVVIQINDSCFSCCLHYTMEKGLGCDLGGFGEVLPGLTCEPCFCIMRHCPSHCQLFITKK